MRTNRRFLQLELLEPRLALTGSDFGDAPTAQQSGFLHSYPTLMEDNGASHLVVGPQLGPNRWESVDGQPGQFANTDVGINAGLAFGPVASLRLPQGEDANAVRVVDMNADGQLDVVSVFGSSNDLSLQLNNETGTFDGPVYTDLGECQSPSDIQLGDLNRDGNMDAVVACRSSDDVLVLLGSGDGTFSDRTRFDLSGGQSPSALSLADVNGDGELDIATANYTSSDVAVLLGRGDGSFRVAYRVKHVDSEAPASLTMGDVDNDGHIDIVTGNNGARRLAVLYGRGDGTFDTTHELSAEVSVSRSTILDLDGDGRNDLLGHRFGGDIIILYGRGDRQFASPKFVWAGGDTRDVSPADVNNDGVMDLIALKGHFQGFSLLVGVGGREFAEAQGVPGAGSADQLAVADLNADGNVDIVTALGVVYGNGDGSFQTASSVDFASVLDIESIASGDFNLDGIPDIATANSGSDDVTVAFGLGDGNFGTPSILHLPSGVSPIDIKTADLNQDGYLDLAVALEQRDAVSLFFGEPDGNFGSEQTVSLLQGRELQSLAIADGDGDGNLDLITANFHSRNVALLAGDGQGGFSTERVIDVGLRFPNKVVAGDFNSDGILDLATATTSRDLSVVLGTGGGNFGHPMFTVRNDRSFTDLTVADATGDGQLDLIAGHFSNNSVTLYVGRGDGTFVPEAVAIGDTSFSGRQVQAGDLNNDGVLDIVASDALTDHVRVAVGTGDGTFGEPQLLPLARSTDGNGLALSDLNVDGRLDIVVATGSSLTSLVNRRGSLRVESFETTQGSGTLDAITADFTSDGIVDLLTVNYDSSDLSLSVGYGDGTFDEPEYFPLGHGRNPRDMAVADFNRDGLLDVATANRGSNNVTLFFGDATEVFMAPVSFSLANSTEPSRIVARDFDGDTFLDLAVSTTEGVSVLWGDGDGEFQLTQTINLGASLVPSHLSAGDVNNDGRDDLLVPANFQAGAGLFINNGDRTFQSSQTIPLSGTYWAQIPTLHDLDGDSNVDLISVNDDFASLDPDALLVRWGNGDGTFEEVQSYSLDTHFGPELLELRDVDGDGNDDVLIGSSGELTVMLNAGGREFATPRHYNINRRHDTFPFDVTALTAEDLDQDGVADLTAHFGGDNLAQTFLGQGDGTFRVPQVDLRRGDSPFQSTSADINSDGLPDLITLNDGDVSVLLANGPGSFEHPIHFELVGGPGSITILADSKDVTGDGQPDIIMIDSDLVQIFEVRADGTLAEPVLLSPGFQVLSADIADLTGDGVFDIVVNSITQTAAAYVSRGDGTFNDPVVFDSGFVDTEAVQLADFTGDGHVDIAIGKSDDGGVVIGIGDGTGAFSATGASGLPAGVNAYVLAVGDFDEDGNLDLVGPTITDSYVALGSGDGKFRLGTPLSVKFRFGHVLVPIDIDQDGHLDLVHWDGSQTIAVLYGNGDGTFANATAGFLRHVTSGITVQDLNQDGRADIVSHLHVTNEVGILLQRSSGGFEPPRYFQTDAGINPSFVESINLNSDGILDLVAWSTESNDLAFLIGYGDGTYRQPVFAPLPSETGTTRTTTRDITGDGIADEIIIDTQQEDFTIVPGDRNASTIIEPLPSATQLGFDINRDSQSDTVLASPHDDLIDIFLGNPDSTQRDFDISPTPTGDNPIDFVVADVDQDGLNDVVTANLSGDVTVLLSDSELTLSLLATSPVLDVPLRAIAAGDLDSDGETDIAVATQSTVAIMLGEGNGSFSLPRVILPATSPTSLTDVWILDLDNDQQLDVVAADSGSETARLLHWGGLGNGEFSEAVAVSVALSQVDLHDFNRDGNVDIIGYDQDTSTIATRLRDEMGGLGEAVAVDAQQSRLFTDVAVSDLNSDGILDLARLNRESNVVTLLHGVGDGTFTFNAEFPVDRNTFEVTPVDLDSDQILDIFLTGAQGLSVAPGNGDGSFEELISVTGPTFHRESRVVDLNNDGFAEIATISSYPQSAVHVVTADGDELFVVSTRTKLGTGAGVQRIATGDLDNDGIDDVVSVHDSEDLLVHLGNGDGSFRIATSIDLPDGGGTSVTLADWDNDHDLDVLVGNSVDGSVWILLGNGGGSFAAPIIFSQPVGEPRYLATADFDLDGNLDVATAGRSNGVTIVFGNASEGFGAHVTIASPTRADALAVGDFNGDSVPDLVTSHGASDEIVQVLGNGDRTWQSPRSIPVPFSSHLYASAGDFNKDGLDDLVVAAGLASTLSTFSGSLNGLEHATVAGIRGEADPFGIRVADADADGQLDILVRDTSSMHVYRGLGDGTFHMGEFVPIDIVDFAVIDTNVDGVPDILGVDSRGFVSVLGSGSATYALPHDLRRPTTTFAVDATLADHNGDGVSDLVVAHLSSDLTVLTGLPHGSFQQNSMIDLGTVGSADSIISADLDDDGTLDLLTANRSSASWNWLRGLGDATFAEPVAFRDLNAHAIAAGDLNDDGQLDVVVGHGRSQGLSIWLGRDGGVPELSSRIPLPNDGSIRSLSLTDVNHDGNLDAVVRSSFGQIIVLEGDGAGQLAVTETINASANSLLVEDFNADAYPDLAVARTFGVLIYYGDQDGSFAAPVTVADSRFHNLNAVGDVNSDGSPDLLASSFATSTLLIQQQDGFEEVRIDLPSRLEWAHVEDINGDGNPDLIGGNWDFFGVQLALGDEHGIHWFSGSSLPRGERTYIRADIRGTDERANYLDAWIDFNRDGDWSDEGEQVLTSTNLGEGDGPRDLHFIIPETAELGVTYARFRLSSGTGLDPFGPANDGEVEDYLVEIVLPKPTDFGDAPTSEQSEFAHSYPTTAIEDGARHVIAGPRLGTTVDGESNGLPARSADGDDTSNDDDEDGVQFGPIIAGAIGTAEVTVNGAAGRLDAWIDFNRDGDWLDTGEQVAASLGFTPGLSRSITFDVPSEDIDEPLYARFRVSSEGGLSPHGAAPDGEVEDYQLLIQDASAPQGIDVDLSATSDVPADAVVQVIDEHVVVTNHGVTVARVPLSAVAGLIVSGTAHDDRIHVEVPSALHELLTIDAGQGMDVLRSIDASGDLQLAVTRQSGLEALDLRNDREDVLSLSALDTGDPSSHFIVYADPNDTFGGSLPWQLGTPMIEEGKFYRTLNRDGLSVLLQSAAAWHNPLAPLDVSGNLSVEPLDVLQIINVLNDQSLPLNLPDPATVAPNVYRYLDTTGDGDLSPLDALLIINRLNQPDAQAEGEAQVTIAHGVLDHQWHKPGLLPYHATLPTPGTLADTDAILAEWPVSREGLTYFEMLRRDFEDESDGQEPDFLIELGLTLRLL